MNRKRNRERRSITGERKREKETEKEKIFLVVGYGATWGKIEPKTKIKKKKKR